MGEITFQVPEGKVSDCGRYTEYAFERAEDFYKYLKLFKILHKDGQWIFRGQWDHTWDLKPNALRNNRYTTIDEFVKNAREEGNRYSCIFRVWREILDIVNFMDVSNKFGLECGFTSEIYKYKSELDRVSNNVSNQHGYLWKIIEDEAVDVFLHPDLDSVVKLFYSTDRYI